MRENENAPPAATGKRVNSPYQSETSYRPPPSKSQVTAAIFVEDHPAKKRQIDSDRPIDIVPIKAGGCVVGHVIPSEQPVRRHRRVKYNSRSHRHREIDKAFRALFPIEDGVIPTRAEARAFAVVIADHAPRAFAFNWIATNLGIELPRSEAEAIVKSSKGRFWKADEIACFLGVTKAIRDELKLRTIGASDFNKRQRSADRKRKDRDRKRARRAAQKCGKVRAIPASKAEPWREIGMSRSRWFELGLNKIYRRDVAAWTIRVRNILKKDSADRKSPDAATLIADLLVAPKRVAELVELSGMSAKVIRPILSRLRAAGKAAPVSRGIWQATSNVSVAGGHQAAAPAERGRTEQAPRMTRPNAAKAHTKTGITIEDEARRSPSADRDTSALTPASIDRVADVMRIAIQRIDTIRLGCVGRALARRPLALTLHSLGSDAPLLSAEDGPTGAPFS